MCGGKALEECFDYCSDCLDHRIGQQLVCKSATSVLAVSPFVRLYPLTMKQVAGIIT